MKPIDFLPQARVDFDESLEWYLERSPQIAERFLNAFEYALSSISRDPLRFALIDRIHRSCPVKRFPFRIVYRVAPDQTIVVAVAHAKRRPRYWTRRK